MTVPAFQGIGTMLETASDDSGESADELQDDGISSSSSDEEDEDEVLTSAPPSPAAKATCLPPLVPQTSADGLLLPALGPLALGVPSLSVSSPSFAGPSASSSGTSPLPTPQRGSSPGPGKTDKKKGQDDYFDLTPSVSGVVTPTESHKKSRAPKFKRKKTGKDWSYSTDSEILGVVLLEIKSAEDLPRLKNVLKIGWVFSSPSLFLHLSSTRADFSTTFCSFDMDPFVVVSFGKKIFRTRVIRHELNPTWNEKLLFHCKKYERSVSLHAPFPAILV